LSVLRKSTVIGAGLMGSQISLILAMGSQEIALMSRSRDSLDRAISNIERYAEDLERHGLLSGGTKEEVLERIWTTTSMEDAAVESEIVVEAVFENIDVKKDVFYKLDHLTPSSTVLASNTSSIPITKIAEATERPERVVGSHFVQPAHIVPIVEVIKGEKTSDKVAERCCQIWRSLGKTPLLIKTDVPGFLINRLQHAIIREATSLIARGIASVEDIDTAVSIGLAPRFTTAGPLEQRDINGISMHYNVASYLWKDLNGFEIPLNYLKEKVERGELGLSVGKGYYDWTGIDINKVRREKGDALIRRTKEILSWRESQAELFNNKSLKEKN
jgi:3-hydroxybutyryl-CoA dehydrogenase